MAIRTINPKLSFRAGTLVITTAVLIAAAIEISALRAKEPSAHPNKMNTANCIRCHNDPKSLMKMAQKEDGAGFLFNRDGTLKDAKVAAQVAQFHQAGAAKSALK